MLSRVAEAVLCGSGGFGATCGNPGVDLGVGDAAPVRPIAVHGPVTGSEAGTALNLSVATFAGRLRPVNVPSRPIAGHLTSIRDVLTA